MAAQSRLRADASTQTAAHPAFTDVLARNIRTLVEIRQKAEQRKGIQERVADAITTFTGSMLFVYIHLAWIGSWVVVNLGWLGIPPFDPYPFGLLTMIGSLEAIFLSTFVLISQNRMAAAADRRAELDLQINLLAEHEVTQTIKLLDAIAQHLGVPVSGDQEIEEAKGDIDPATVIEAIEVHEEAQTAKAS
jgi:uncharacterized membrane protein